MPAINFPASPSVNDTFTASGKTWRWNGTFWELVISGASVADGSVSTAKIADSAITNPKLASGAVHSVNIATGAVTAAKLGNDIQLTPPDGSITQAKLAASLSAITATTTANRSTAVPSPFTGQTIFLTDVKRMQVWDGSTWMFMTVGVPDAPTSLSATPLSTTSVSVAFTAGSQNGSIISNYKYALSTNGGSTYSEYAALDPADAVSPITISGLTGATTYHIKLKAVADFGDSVDSSAVSATTLTPPGAPTSLSATVLSGTSVSIAFTAGATGGSAFTNMEYALSTNSGATYGAYTAFSPPDYTTPVVISGLTENTQYTIKLRHVTTAGAGPDSAGVIITTPIDVEYLVVAGGGGGCGSANANTSGGGGGAGGYRSSRDGENTGGGLASENKLVATPSTNYAVTLGGGGAGSSSYGTPGTNGVNSSFASITSTGGGGGGNYTAFAQNGGSGGGSGTRSSATYQPAGTGVSGQGFAGGVGTAYGNGGAAGGGGAGAVGGNASGNTAGNGGIGVTSTITGSSVTRGGGGGGGTFNSSASSGGAGGGGAGGGGANTNGTSGTANTGGGGGGSASTNGTNTGGSGGSGIVILRYSSARTITIGAGLTGSTATDGAFKVTTITSGSGNVSWA